MVDNKFYKGHTYRVFQIRIDSAVTKNITFKQNFKFLSLADLAVEEMIFNSKVFLFNACINDSVGQPLGLFVLKGTQKAPINLSSGFGNFFLKPNGVLSISKNNVRITESSNYFKSDTVITAVQSGPMLLIDDRIHQGFDSLSSNLNLRSGVGVFEDGNQKYLVFAVSDDPVNFYDFASFFKNIYKCKNALCLESVNTIFFDSTQGINVDEADKIVANYFKIEIPNGKNKSNR